MTSPSATNKTAIGISWGSDTGVVSNSVITNKQLQTLNIAEIIKQPSVLANADGNRAPSLWLSVANEEFLLSDGARNATLRFPQQGLHGIVNLLCPSSAKETLRKEKSQNQEGGFNCMCGCPCACKKVRVYEAETEENDGDGNGEGDVEDEMTNVKPMTVHTDAKDSTLAEFQGKLSAFLDQKKRNLKIDADGVIPKTKFTVEGEDDDGKPTTEETVRLPETTWECALGVARIFRSIIKDSLTGGAAAGATSPTTPAKDSVAFPSSSSGLDQPTTIVVSIPRHRTNTYAAYSLLRLAWHDWCMNSPKNQYPTQLKIVHDDVAAFAAVLPKDRLLNCANDKSFDQNLSTPHLALVVNWGATQLTVSLMLQTCEPVVVAKTEDSSPAKKSYPMMICLASKSLDREVGGYFIDLKITETELMMSAKRKKLPPIDPSDRGYRKFLSAAERAKIVLSSSQTTPVEIEAAVEGMDFVEPSFTRSKLENVITAACKLPTKFNDLVTALFAEFKSTNNKLLPLFSRDGKINFGVVISGGTLAIPYLQNHVKTQGAQMLEKFLQQNVSETSAIVELVNANYSFAGLESQEICSMGACFLAQTGCIIDISSTSAASTAFTLSPEKKRATIFAKPQLSLLSCDILLLKKQETEGGSGNGLLVFPHGCNVPAKRQITGDVSKNDFSGFLIVNRSTKNVVKVPFAEDVATESMGLLCTITPDGILRVTDAKNGGAKVCEVQLA